jgi:hypothetical protein
VKQKEEIIKETENGDGDKRIREIYKKTYKEEWQMSHLTYF